MQVGLVVLNGEQEVPVRLKDHPRQRPLGEQGVGGEEAEHRVVAGELGQRRLQGLRLGGLAVGHGELGQAQPQFVREDVEHVDGVAVGVVPLFARLAVDGDRDGGGLWERGQPPREARTELLQ